ncbi:MAG: tetratricopeptide repeat protein [Armatimonadota bacterium]|nr:tetratricopeptide repeat protein [Armatimonadota bacterium]
MPDKPIDHNLLEGEKFLDAGEWTQAEAAFRRAIEANANSAVAYSKLGVALVHQRRVDEAERAFAKAVAIDPRYAPAWSNLGNVYRESGRLDEALQAYERAVAADPDYWIAHQNLGGLYKQMGRMSEAISSLKKATRLSIKAPIRRPGEATPRRAGCLSRAAMLVLVLAGALALWMRG